MADLPRSAKAGGEWTQNEISAFNIDIQTVDVATFFNTAELPPATMVSETILNCLDRLDLPDGELPKSNRQFFSYLNAADEEESGVVDFTVFLLSTLLEYDSGGRLVRMRRELPFYMAGQLVRAKAGVSLSDWDHGDAILLVTNHKCKGSTEDPEPGLIAALISAFAHNQYRRKFSGLPVLESQDIVGFTMVGSAPVFYRATLSTPLLDALVSAMYPEERTDVLKYVPQVPDQTRYQEDGMRPLENRRVVFQCFEALQKLVVSLP